LRLRVGALAQFPDNVLRYNLTWSTEGLINEYCNPCEIIHDGARREVLPLEGLEQFSLDGVNYEAFATSGGIGSLCETLDGKVRNLSYKTVRYPGHRDMIQMLARDLKLCENRETFKHLIETGIPITRQDVVIIFVTVTGLQGGMLAQESFVRKVLWRYRGRGPQRHSKDHRRRGFGAGRSQARGQAGGSGIPAPRTSPVRGFHGQPVRRGFCLKRSAQKNRTQK
jgi:saccharopine dehydrogenase-like NADP-dependent oxidoreductase